MKKNATMIKQLKAIMESRLLTSLLDKWYKATTEKTKQISKYTLKRGILNYSPARLVSSAAT